MRIIGITTRLKPLLKAKVEEECKARGRSDCDLNGIEKIPFRDLNFTVDDVWKAHSFNNMKIKLSLGMDKSIKIKDYLIQNKTSDDFQFTPQDTVLGSCLIIRHIGKVTYISTVTRLILYIHETDIHEIGKVQYYIIPHGETNDRLTSFEFLSYEFEIFPNGYAYKLKLHEESFYLKNVSNRLCFDEKEESNRIKKCALEVLQPNHCRLPCYPESFRECKTLQDIRDPNKTEFYSQFEQLSRRCSTTRPICNETQNLIYIDYALDSFNINTTTIVFRMADDTFHVVEQFVDYDFPDLISDLFAYWGFFLSLTALVFAEIFEYVIKSIIGCIRGRLNNFKHPGEIISF